MERNTKSTFKQDGKNDDGRTTDKAKETELGKTDTALEEALIFGRRDSLKRTPPGVKRFRSSSAPSRDTLEEVGQGQETPKATEAEAEADRWQDECLGSSPIYELAGKVDKGTVADDDGISESASTFSWEEKENYADNPVQTEKKRKRVKTPPQLRNPLENMRPGVEIQEVENMVSKVVKRTKELKKLVDESTKTKVEIKQLARELNSLVDNLDKRMKSYKANHSCFVNRKMCDKAIQASPNCSAAGVQVDSKDIESEKQEAEARIRKKIGETLRERQGFTSIADLLDVPWPEDMFARTKIEALNMGRLNGDGDHVIFLDAEGAKDNRVLESLTPLYPDLSEVISKNEGQIDYILKNVETKTKSMIKSQISTALYILPTKIYKEEVTNMEEVHSSLVELKDTMQVHPTERLNIILSDGLSQVYLRKLAEHVFANTNVNITLLVASKTHQKVPARNNIPRQQTERLIIKNAGNTYADLLKTVKGNVNLSEVGVNVKTIRKTRAGDLMLQVEGDKRKAGALKEAISSKTGSQVRVANNTITLHVLDIDAVTTKQEVEEAIRALLPGSGQDIAVKSMRPCRDGNQIATVQANRATASKLAKTGRVRIGWVDCRVRERLGVLRCYRCLEFGHSSRDCQGPDRSNLCINCTQEGHKANECKEIHYCLMCNTNDHRADTTRCPNFRQLLSAQRKTQVTSKNAKK